MIGFVVFSLRRAWQGFWRNALMSLAATATMVLMLLLLAGFWILQTGLLSALDFTESKVEVQVNMKVDATPIAIERLGATIRELPGVAGVTLITREEALARFQESMKNQDREDLSKYLDTNPFPPSYEIKLTDPSYAGSIAEALQPTKNPAVRNVLDTKETAQNVKTVTDLMRTGGSVILVVIGVIVLFSLGRAWQGFWRNAVMSLAATATMVLMLLLLAGFWIIQTGLLAGLQFTEQKVEVVGYLQPNAQDNQVQVLKGRLEAMPEVAAVTYVDRETALANFRASMAAQGREDLTRYLDSNPLYASLEVKLVDPTNVRAVGEAMRADPIIRNVINIEDLVDRVLTVTNILRTAGTVVLIVVGLIALFIIINTIRLAVVARAEEIEIMRLVGASDAFIRWPFVFEGAFVGLLGALLALGVLAAVADPIGGFMVEFFRVLPLQFGSLTRDLIALVLGTGVGLGVLGSWLSVRTYLIR